MSGEVDKKQRVINCTVTSDKMNKSRVARVDRLVKHGLYNKYIRRSGTLMFHDEENTAKVGDKCLVASCRPLSGRKKFKLVEVVERARR